MFLTQIPLLQMPSSACLTSDFQMELRWAIRETDLSSCKWLCESCSCA